MSKKQFEDVSCKYGAPMGRPECHNDFSGKARCFKVKMVDLCYDDGGAYWGMGVPLYCATNGEGFRMFTRQPNRRLAKADIRWRVAAFNKTISWIN